MTRTGNEIVGAHADRVAFPGSATRRRLRAIVELTRDSKAGMDFVVQGDCMAPLFRAGDRVRVESRRIYLPGDVLAFIDLEASLEVQGERLLVHRLLGYDRRHGRLNFVTGADAAPGFDPPFPREQILGCIAAVSRGGDPPVFAPLRIPLLGRFSALWRFVRLALPAAFRRLGRISR